MLGIDMLQINSSSTESRSEIKTLTEFRERFTETLPVYSGNIHSGNVEKIIKSYGYDLVIEAGISIDEHPDGIKAGSEALQYAIETATQGIEMESASKKNEPFRRALESWNGAKEVTRS
jgi:2,3-diketo-5-methylthiopentyl-1-phosphate enolase